MLHPHSFTDILNQNIKPTKEWFANLIINQQKEQNDQMKLFSHLTQLGYIEQDVRGIFPSRPRMLPLNENICLKYFPLLWDLIKLELFIK